MVTPPYYFTRNDWESKIYWNVQDIDLPHGRIPREAVTHAQPGSSFTLKNHTYTIHEARITDIIRHFTRGAQIVTLKDAAYIAYRTSMMNGIILDAGTGSGASAAAFSLVAREVYTFEPRDDHARIAEKNIQKLRRLGHGKNITLEKKRVEDINRGEYPLFTHAFLDLPSPAEKAMHIHTLLAEDAWLIIYTPHITQQARLHTSITRAYEHQETFEIPLRHWKVNSIKARPEKTILHTAFISLWKKKA